MPITLGKENWVANYIITMFSIVNEATNDKKIIIDGNKITFRKKEVDEIFDFKADGIENLETKIFEGFLEIRLCNSFI